MIKTSKPDEIWADFDACFEPEPLPVGAITVKDIMDKYGVSTTTAKHRMDVAVKSGWANGYVNRGSLRIRYIYNEQQTAR